VTESWHIDLKNKGEVGKGLGEKPTGNCPLFSELQGKCGEHAWALFLLFMMPKLTPHL
jgi:hypothetical protein